MKNLFIAVLIISLTANLILVFMATNLNTKQSWEEQAAQTNQNQFPYLSKRIFVEEQNDILINFISLRTVLREYISKLPNLTGIYFEYLPSGTSIGVNDTESFFGASLVKIPIVMRVNKLIEQGKLAKDKEITIDLIHLNKNFGELWRNGLGTTITLGEAIQLTLTQSDNTAEEILREQIKDYPFSEVYDYIDVKPGTSITPKNFSSMLRSLYLSAYLQRQNSNEILEILTTSPFDDQIVAGIPKEVRVAHKTGFYKPGPNDSEVHSDCGIVYVPNRPYIICIMSKANLDESAKIMREISKIVYEYVSTVQGGN